MIQLGQKVRDVVSGLEGIVTGRTEYLNGCIQYCVKPPLDKDGKMQEAWWIDEGQLEVIEGSLPLGTMQKLRRALVASKEEDAEPEEGGPGGPAMDSPPTTYRG